MKKIGVVGLTDGWSSEVLADACGKLTGFRLLVDMDKAVLDLDAGTVRHEGQDLLELDALIVKKIAPQYSPDVLDRLEMLRFLELRGLPVFSRPSSILRLVDRLSCTVTLRAAGLPMPPTVVTESVEEARDAVERFGRAVFKPLYSTKARGMEVIEAGPDALRRVQAFKDAGNAVMYLQKMLPPLEKDLGVTYLGGKYLATYARKSGGSSWNTTTAAGGRYVAHEPSAEIVALAEKAQSLFDMAFTCVDVAETAQGPIVFEVSAFGGFRGLRDACGIDAAQAYAKHVLEVLS
ncbi:Alpha-aminoadipate--LysW ligase LysX [Fundidesulfovibrio magnetotacticus]|uniref:Alpha-aminoadipate--LysW ligase LysX n=1 Tax=Fundidesulfovibrio magnetotacticus TaxID=2730080 RepID=A0A6V8LTD1_9BACT|nr:GAK system ATP-grasp enzyme [Fundidesulfovibrio magnetotacticus]GFK95723.1 Alpha-aminoadipate--LysW ligase LysX [Fundidesulfovibrio magnetotacticus]